MSWFMRSLVIALILAVDVFFLLSVESLVFKIALLVFALALVLYLQNNPQFIFRKLFVFIVTLSLFSKSFEESLYNLLKSLVDCEWLALSDASKQLGYQFIEYFVSVAAADKILPDALLYTLIFLVLLECLNSLFPVAEKIRSWFYQVTVSAATPIDNQLYFPSANGETTWLRLSFKLHFENSTSKTTTIYPREIEIRSLLLLDKLLKIQATELSVVEVQTKQEVLDASGISLTSGSSRTYDYSVNVANRLERWLQYRLLFILACFKVKLKGTRFNQCIVNLEKSKPE